MPDEKFDRTIERIEKIDEYGVYLTEQNLKDLTDIMRWLFKNPALCHSILSYFALIDLISHLKTLQKKVETK